MTQSNIIFAREIFGLLLNLLVLSYKNFLNYCCQYKSKINQMKQVIQPIIAKMIQIRANRDKQAKKQVEDQIEIENLINGKYTSNLKQCGKKLEICLKKHQGKQQKISYILKNTNQILDKIPEQQNKDILKTILSMKNKDNLIVRLKQFNQQIYQKEADYGNKITQSEITITKKETKSKGLRKKERKKDEAFQDDEEEENQSVQEPQVYDLVNYELLQDNQPIEQECYSSSLKDQGIDIVYIPSTFKDILGQKMPWTKVTQLIKKSTKAQKVNQTGVKDLRINGKIIQELKFLGKFGDIRLFGIVYQINNKKVLMFRKQGSHKTKLKKMVKSLVNMQQPNLRLIKSQHD